jgi:hypothetical protein
MGVGSDASIRRALFAALDSTPARTQVVDLCANGGGNSAVANPLIDGLKARGELGRSGRLFVITGGNTFAAAVTNAFAFKRDANAIPVGEPAGGKPHCCTELRTFRLPNSGLQVGYWTQFRRLIPDADPPALMPDIPVELSSADYLAGRDPVLEAIPARVGP